MGLGMLMSLFMKNTRFAELNKKLAKLSAVVLIGTTASFAQDRSIVDDTVGHNGHDHSGHDHSAHEHEHDHAQAPAKKKNYKFLYMTEEHSDELASLLVQDFRGRIVPFHTLADQVMRKVYRGNELENEAKTLNAVQTFMSVMMYPGYWEDKELIYVSSKGGLREKLKLKGTHTTPLSLVDNDFNFVLNDDYRKAHQKMESRRGEYDKQVIKLHDHFQLFLEWVNWARFKIVPVQNDSLNTWTTPMLMEADSVDIPSYQLAGAYIQALDQAIVEKDYSQANLVLKKLKTLQRKIGADVVPSETMVAAEISYNKQGIFKRVANYYAYLGFALLIAFFLKIMRSSPSEKSKKIGKWIVRSLVGLLVVTVLYHAYGLVLRAIITQEVPWTNGYEAMVFISLMVMVTGFALSRKHAVILAGASILAYLLMFVNEMSLLDPEITPLVPVLKSYWLKIHVAIITGSYAPLGLASILGLITMILYVVRGKNNGVQMTNNIKALTYINEMLMIVGVFMLTIGTFLGGVWANESWGRYWGWDAKETWALVAVLCYGVILHFRFIPALRGKFLLNAASFWGYSTILFTFFGVNFYLVGLHSYAQGEGFGSFPTWLIVTVVILIAFTVVASIRNRQYKRHQTAIKSIENE